MDANGTASVPEPQVETDDGANAEVFVESHDDAVRAAEEAVESAKAKRDKQTEHLRGAEEAVVKAEAELHDILHREDN